MQTIKICSAVLSLKNSSDSILDRENSANEYDITPSRYCACLNHIHPVNIIYARAVNCFCCMVTEFESDFISRLGKSISVSEYDTLPSEYDFMICTVDYRLNIYYKRDNLKSLVMNK
jgi:hypothetical protein